MRTAFEIKNKTLLKKNKTLIDDYFEEHCQSTGTASTIQLKPIMDGVRICLKLINEE